jgi:ferrous iron transport protein B
LAHPATKLPRPEPSGGPPRRLVIVGTPNVGKSVTFNALTGAYAVVSNYPGTTVEVISGRTLLNGVPWEVSDTPGMYSLLCVSEEERVARRMLFAEPPGLVLHVVDAKNLERMLPLTLQLIEAGLPVLLQVNMMDEAERLGIHIDAAALERALGVPVVLTALGAGHGLIDLKRALVKGRGAERQTFRYGRQLEDDISRAEALLPPDVGMPPRAAALLLLQGDDDVMGRVSAAGQGVAAQSLLAEAATHFRGPLPYAVAMERQRLVGAVVAEATTGSGTAVRVGWEERLSLALINPWTGLPVLFLVLYLGFYKIVGGLGAGVLVDFLEKRVFEGWLNPLVSGAVAAFVPWAPLRDLLAGEYGVITLGVRYAVAIILPLVTIFFLVFSVLEDTGYLPRLSLLIDRVFKQIGLSGRAVIPMVLGLGCDTMATMVTRTLPTRRERLIATLLLALAIPCSAQLGVIFSLMAGRPLALTVWAGTVTAVFLLVGSVVARLLPGERPSFYIEVPPLRLPALSNVLNKTLARVTWYLKEIVPIFIAVSVLIWVGQMVGLFQLALRGLAGPLAMLGLPPAAAPAFLFGFFRRDYGAAGLYDLQAKGILTTEQVVVAAVTLTLFLPCVAQFITMVKERGLKAGVGIGLFVLVFSFSVGLVLHLALTALGVAL